jgi:hypothetical protein
MAGGSMDFARKGILSCVVSKRCRMPSSILRIMISLENYFASDFTQKIQAGMYDA